jgi:hypothetical protein
MTNAERQRRYINRLKARAAHAEGPPSKRMSRATFNKIRKALHPESNPTEKQRAEAYQVFLDWYAQMGDSKGRGRA